MLCMELLFNSHLSENILAGNCCNFGCKSNIVLLNVALHYITYLYLHPNTNKKVFFIIV